MARSPGDDGVGQVWVVRAGKRMTHTDRPLGPFQHEHVVPRVTARDRPVPRDPEQIPHVLHRVIFTRVLGQHVQVPPLAVPTEHQLRLHPFLVEFGT